MARKTKCRACLAFDNSTKVKYNNMYFHEGECLNKYLAHQKFLEREQEEKDDLFYYLVDLHKLDKTTDIPPLFYQRIEDLRNDNWVLGRFDKKYKKGVRYSGIKYTYEFCHDKIQAALTKMADKPLLEQMNYCLGIVRNNIADAFRHAKNNAKQKQNIVKQVEEIKKMSSINEKIKQAQSNVKNEQDEEKIDLTTLLD